MTRRASRNTLDSAIGAVAGRQHGVIARGQLLDLGLTNNAIAHRLTAGRLHRLYAGVYAVGHRPVSPYGHALAAVLACGSHAVLSHGSAATLWGVARRWQTPLEVTVPTLRRPPGLHVHRSKTLSRRDITRQHGIRTTSPARTLLDIADRLTDAALARAVNDLRLARYLWRDDLAELLDRHGRTTATKRLRRHLDRFDRGPTRSEFEDAFLAFIERFDLPEPQVNTYVAGHEADVYFPAQKLVVEVDGYQFHSSREQFERDRDRDADLLAAGIATVRLTWERLQHRPAPEAARLHSILRDRTSSR